MGQDLGGIQLVLQLILWDSQSFSLPTDVCFVLMLTFLQKTWWLPALTGPTCCPIRKHGKIASKSLCKTIKQKFQASRTLPPLNQLCAKEKPGTNCTPGLSEPIRMARTHPWNSEWNQPFQKSHSCFKKIF